MRGNMIFRDDDISVDCNMNQVREISSIIEKYGQYMPSVVPFGKTTPLHSGYSPSWDIETFSVELGSVPITMNKEVCDWLKGRECILHGSVHARMVEFDRDHLLREISIGKKLLEDISGKPVQYFAAPFNLANDVVLVVIEELGMIYLGAEGDQLEFCIRDGKPLTTWFTWFHHWRFYLNDKLTPKILEDYLCNQPAINQPKR